MDHQWEKPGKSGKNRPQQSQNQPTPPDLDDTFEVWDFERPVGSASDTAFNFTRRQVVEPGYRLIGGEVEEAVANGGHHRPVSLSKQTEILSRPNRFNSGVKMVAGDSGPAPWDTWNEVPYLKMPITGEVAAGRYDVTVAYHEPGGEVDSDFVLVNSTEVKVSKTTFALRVRGQSMIENEIDDGDVVIVQAQDWADDGDFVIACLADSSDAAGFVTLKRFYRHRQADRVVLQPANQSLNPIHILPHKGDAASEDLDAVKIQGRVTTIIKTNGLYK